MNAYPSEYQKHVKLMIIGLDGATWTVIDPLIKAGLMKNLGGIIEKSAKGILNSIIPPVTGPAWPVLATGLNPGRLGTYDFYNRANLIDSNLYPVRSRMIRGKTFWDSLSNKGFRIGIFNYPMLIPAYEINGWMIAGLGASKLHNWAWPNNLKEELEKFANPYRISISYGETQYLNNLTKLLIDLGEMHNNHINALEYLLKKYPVDILVYIFSITDILSHTTWHIIDKQHPLYDEKVAECFLPTIKELWKTVDYGIGNLFRYLHPNGNALFVSDHGFGPNFGVFNINVWLERNGYLTRNNKLSQASNKLRAKLVNKLSPCLSNFFGKIQGSRAHLGLRESVLREIDLSRTKAFSIETTDVCGMVFINREYPRINHLNEDQFVANTTAEIKEKLVRYASTTDLELEIFSSRDIYHGDFTMLAPELIFKVNDSAVSVNYKLADQILENRQHHLLKTGNHRQEGIFVGYGSKFLKGFNLAEPISILDITPTIYQILGEPIPKGLDGQAAIDALGQGFRKTQYCDTCGNVKPGSELPSQMERSEIEEMHRRLRDLGYIE
jgi:predicted AlkP superfamily phosphohydrolase/phosphomutase